MRPLIKACGACARHEQAVSRRLLSSSTRNHQEIVASSDSNIAAPPPPPPPSEHKYNPNFVHTPRTERKLFEQQRRLPIGSRRRRAALASTSNIPFEQLPYQCFQDARNVLQEDRTKVVEEIRVQRERIARLVASKVEPQNEAHQETRLRSMRQRLEQLKIWADINDPLVKKRFEDGFGDMNKPIYRHLADLKWRSYKRKVAVQRIEQMNIVPDVLPKIDPVVSTALSFGPRKVPIGDFVDSRVSEIAPSINIQPYDAGSRLVTIAVVTPDVPNVASDGFSSRCHFLACNVLVSPTSTNVSLADLDPEAQVIIPWLPPYSQKGAPYQRMPVVILEQPPISSREAQAIQMLSTSRAQQEQGQSRSVGFDVAKIKASNTKYTEREGFSLRALVDRFRLRPVGSDLFRTQWDEGTAGVMHRLGVPGADVEFRRKRVEPLPYKRLKGERFR